MRGCVQEEVELRILFNEFMETGRSFPSRHKATPRSSHLQGKDSTKASAKTTSTATRTPKKSNRFNKDCYSVNILLYSSFCHFMFGCIPMYSDVFNHLSGPLLISGLLKGQIPYKYRYINK